MRCGLFPSPVLACRGSLRKWSATSAREDEDVGSCLKQAVQLIPAVVQIPSAPRLEARQDSDVVTRSTSQRRMSLPLLKFSGGSVDDYAICRSSLATLRPSC